MILFFFSSITGFKFRFADGVSERLANGSPNTRWFAAEFLGGSRPSVIPLLAARFAATDDLQRSTSALTWIDAFVQRDSALARGPQLPEPTELRHQRAFLCRFFAAEVR